MEALEIPGYTVKEAEKIAGLPYNTIYKLIRNGEIEATRDVNGQVRVPYAAMLVYMNTRKTEG